MSGTTYIRGPAGSWKDQGWSLTLWESALVTLEFLDMVFLLRMQISTNIRKFRLEQVFLGSMCMLLQINWKNVFIGPMVIHEVLYRKSLQLFPKSSTIFVIDSRDFLFSYF